jgi:hypothetical protein
MNRLCCFLFAMLMLISACGSPGPDAAAQTALVGVWKDQSVDQILELTEDGRGTLGLQGLRYKWVSETEIEIDYSPRMPRANVVRYQVEVDADTLKLVWQEGEASYTQTFKRVE